MHSNEFRQYKNLQYACYKLFLRRLTIKVPKKSMSASDSALPFQPLCTLSKCRQRVEQTNPSVYTVLYCVRKNVFYSACVTKYHRMYNV